MKRRGYTLAKHKRSRYCKSRPRREMQRRLEFVRRRVLEWERMYWWQVSMDGFCFDGFLVR